MRHRVGHQRLDQRIRDTSTAMLRGDEEPLELGSATILQLDAADSDRRTRHPRSHQVHL